MELECLSRPFPSPQKGWKEDPLAAPEFLGNSPLGRSQIPRQVGGGAGRRT